MKFWVFIQANAMAVSGLLTAMLAIVFAFVKLTPEQTAVLVGGVSALMQFVGHVVIKVDGVRNGNGVKTQT